MREVLENFLADFDLTMGLAGLSFDRRDRPGGAQPVGLMFPFSRNRLSGSYSVLQRLDPRVLRVAERLAHPLVAGVRREVEVDALDRVGVEVRREPLAHAVWAAAVSCRAPPLSRARGRPTGRPRRRAPSCPRCTADRAAERLRCRISAIGDARFIAVATSLSTASSLSRSMNSAFM